MNFHEMPYQRVSYEDLAQRYESLIQAMKAAPDPESCFAVLRQREQLDADMTPISLCYLRHDMDVNDAFYGAEQTYYDEISPRLADLSNQLDRAILESPHRAAMEEVLGKQVMTLMEQDQLGFDSRLIALSQAENELLSRHNQLLSNATVLWEGKQVKRDLMTPFTQSADRETRRQASKAVAESWESQRPELEALYSSLVQNRHQQAKTLGFQNYAELSYIRMNRVGYGIPEVSRFRDLVKHYLSPVLGKIQEQRRQRLGLDHLYSYDLGLCFPNGNPIPQGDTAACLAATREMYTCMSPETAEFIGFLLDNGLYDVEIRPGKRTGGYMMHLEQYLSPFVFANFDGTSENAYIMCHEGGHAFQDYLKRTEPVRARCRLTSEAAEAHAMAMEFFAWPYMELFFGDRAADYRTMHLENAVQLIARECLQDEFEQRVYEQPDLSPDARNALWRELEKAYLPGRDYSDNPHLEQGCSWQHIPHVFQWPFYAIDYALAQVCALEYCRWMQQDSAAAWDSYLTFCRETGRRSFPELVRFSGLGDPFQEEILSELASWLKTMLDQD